MREIVLLPWSLRLPESAAQHWLNAVNPAEDCLLLFRDFAQYCEASNLTVSYHAILSGLNRRGIRTRILAAMGWNNFCLPTTVQPRFIPLRSQTRSALSPQQPSAATPVRFFALGQMPWIRRCATLLPRFVPFQPRPAPGHGD